MINLVALCYSSLRRWLDRIVEKRTFKLTTSPLFILFLSFTSHESTRDSAVVYPSKPQVSSLKVAEAGKFIVISYNIAGLPAIISSAVTERSSSIAEIGRRLNRFDIVHVQEDFNYHQDLYGQGNRHIFRSDTKGGVPFGDGLNTLSSYPVRHLRRISWNDCTGADCLTPKGFTYSTIEVAKDVFIDFYNIHANAFNHLSAASARRRNIQQFSDFIKYHSSGNAVIVMGDINGHYSYWYDNIRLLATENGLEDVWISHRCKGKFPITSKQLPVSNILALTDTNETIDKILYRSSQNLKLKVTAYQFENLSFLNEQGLPLSDHHPVSAEFVWSTRKMVEEYTYNETK